MSDHPFDDAPPHVAALLSDPLTQMVMRADHVDEGQLLSMLSSTFEKLSKGSTEGPASAEERTTQNYRPSVGIMLLNSRDQVFVGKRRRTAGDAWQMPQGGIESGEEPLAAALRELKEEIGTDNARLIGESKSWLFYEWPTYLLNEVPENRWRGQRQKWFAMRFLGSDSDINVETEVPEFSDWKWVDVRSLPDLIVSFKRLVYLSVLEEFQLPLTSLRPHPHADNDI